MLLDKDSVLSKIDDLKAQIDALPDATPSSDQQAQIDALTAQVADLQKKNEDAAAALTAEIAKESDDVAQISALQAKIDAAKAALS